MKRKRIVVAVIVFASLALVLAACGHSRFAGYRDAPPEKRVEWIKQHIADELKLDAVQNEKLHAIAADLMERHKKAKPDHQKGRLELAALVRSENINREDLERLVDKKRSHIEEMVDVVMDHAVDFHQMLTPEQRILLFLPPVNLKARTLVILYGLFELYAGVTGTLSGIAHFAHLGGMLGGYLAIRRWSKSKR